MREVGSRWESVSNSDSSTFTSNPEFSFFRSSQHLRMTTPHMSTIISFFSCVFLAVFSFLQVSVWFYGSLWIITFIANAVFIIAVLVYIISLIISLCVCVCVCVCAPLTSGVEENLQEVIGHITEGVCRPLKVSNRISSRSFAQTDHLYLMSAVILSCCDPVMWFCSPGSYRTGHCGRARGRPPLQAVQPAQVLPPHHQVFLLTHDEGRSW